MADFKQIPGELNIEVSSRDDLHLSLDFDIGLTGGYSFLSNVVTYEGTSVPIFVTGTNLLLGQLDLVLNDSDLGNIPVGDHNWYFDWTIHNESRRILAGKFKVINYPP